MGHEDKGHYAGKHENQTTEPRIIQMLTAAAQNGTITCALAHKTAASLNLAPKEIGLQIDLAELQITHCQVGLFGYPDTGKKFDPGFNIDPDLKGQIIAKSPTGRLACADAWDLAKTFKLKRLDIGSACERLGIKIKPCQLGTF